MNEEFITRPEIVAAKLDAIRTGDGHDLCQQALDYPRYGELLLALQKNSTQAGELVRYTEKFLDRFSHRLGTATMLTLGEWARWTIEQKLAIAREIPRRHLPSHAADEYWLLSTFWKDFQASTNYERVPYSLDRGLDQSPFDAAVSTQDKPRLEEILKEFDFVQCQKLCRDAALADLPGRLFRFCSEPQSPLNEVWYFKGLIDALFEMLDDGARNARHASVVTEISRQVDDALSYAASSGGMVRIETDGRYLEKENVAAWCADHPGTARLVETPCENSDLEFYRALAKSVGFDTAFKSVTSDVRAKIVAFAQSTRLLFVFQNAQHLLPSRFNHNTPPMRLSWIATRLLEHCVPVALVATKRDFDHAAIRFKAVTENPFDNWLGQEALTFTLPNQLSREDRLTLARSCFPGIEIGLLTTACIKASQTGYFLSDVRKILSLAQHYATSAGRADVLEGDVDAAIAKLIGDTNASDAPGAQASTERAPAAAAQAATIQKPRSTAVASAAGARSIRPAAPPPAPAQAIPPQRQTTPALVAA